VLLVAVLVHSDHAWFTLLFSFWVMTVNKLLSMNTTSATCIDNSRIEDGN